MRESSKYRSLVERIKACTRCRLHEGRKNPVPGEGSIKAEVMLIGEAPGRQEDESGRPFVGAAGKLLDYLLSLAGLRREEVYITNVVKCRPPKNRDPRNDEIDACLPYLLEQIKLIRPKVIITLGRIAGQTIYTLMGKKWRGMWAEHGVAIEGSIEGVNVRVVPTFHPAAALYKPDVRKILEEDFRHSIKEAIVGAREGERRRRTLLDYM